METLAKFEEIHPTSDRTSTTRKSNKHHYNSSAFMAPASSLCALFDVTVASSLLRLMISAHCRFSLLDVTSLRAKRLMVAEAVDGGHVVVFQSAGVGWWVLNGG